MDIKITYEEAMKHHRDLVDILIGKIQASKAKDKTVPAKDWEWYYSYGVTVKGMSFGEMMNDVFNRQNKEQEEEKSTQEVINEQLKSVIGLSLTASVGRTRRYYVLPDKPKLFIEKFSEMSLKGMDDRKKEEDRLSKLTPEEKERETQEHINELTKMGGFAGFNVGPNGVKKIEPKKIEYNLDDVLDKISRVGMEGLTDGEKEFLKNESA